MPSTDLKFRELVDNCFDFQLIQPIYNIRFDANNLSKFFINRKSTPSEHEWWYYNVYSKQPDYKIVLVSHGEQPIGYYTLRVDSIFNKRLQFYLVMNEGVTAKVRRSNAILKDAIARSKKMIIDAGKLWSFVLPQDKETTVLYNMMQFEKEARLKGHVYNESNQTYNDVMVYRKMI